MTDLLDAPSETAPEIPTTDAAVAAALRDGLTHLRARLDAPDLADATTIHELRVALRRVRTVLAVIARAAPTDAVAALRTAAGALADVIGEARDWDVFITETLVRHAPDPGTDGHAGLVAVAEELRQAAHRRLADYRAGRETAGFLRMFAQVVDGRRWRDASDALWAAPLDELARPTLDRLHARVLKRGHGLGRRDAAERHVLRLAVKRLRYAVDLFAPVLAGDGAAGYRRRLVALQDKLGHGNDRVTARRLASIVAEATDQTDVAAAVAALSVRLDDADTAEEAVLKAAWRRFRHRAPFWHDEA
jgi:CHAD domain-containing protein